MVQGIDNILKPNYNAVKINIKNPQVNAEYNTSKCTDCISANDGIYNAVSIDIDEPQVNTVNQSKNIYDYPEYNGIVTYDMAAIAPVALPDMKAAYYEKYQEVNLPKEQQEDLADDITVPEPNYTTVENEKGLNCKKDVSFHGTENVKTPEIIKGEDIKPNVDIQDVVSKLESEDFDIQAKQMEEIARKAMENKEDGMQYIVKDVFSSLIKATEKETVNLTPPTEAQIEARKKIIMNAIAIEQNPKITPDKLPFPMSEQDIQLANEISPMEQAERNKEYAIYTMAILSKIYADEIEEKTGNVVPLTDLPGASAMIDALRHNPNAGVKVAAIDGLRYIQRPEYNEELSTVYSLAQQDTNPMVSLAAEHALNMLK